MMTEKQPKQPKCKITQEQLTSRFYQADTDGNGKLSAEQITQLLQKLGYQDTYKGTIRKICRMLQKKSIAEKSQLTNEETTKSIKQIDEHPQIGFQQFQQYFHVLQNPIQKMLFSERINLNNYISQVNSLIKQKKIFQSDKGQKLKALIQIGEPLQNYNSLLDIRITKQKKGKKKPQQNHIQLQIQSLSAQGALILQKQLNGLYQTIKLIIIDSEQISDTPELFQYIQFQTKVQGNICKLRITTQNQLLNSFIDDYTQMLDGMLMTQITWDFNFKVLFHFILDQLRTNPNAIIQNVFTQNCQIHFAYIGSQFMNSVKELALAHDFFEILRDADPYNPEQLLIMAFLETQQIDINLKFKNVTGGKVTKQITQVMLETLQQFAQFQSQTFSFQNLAQNVSSKIFIKAKINNIKFQIKIDIKDLLKLPLIGSGGSGSQSD